MSAKKQINIWFLAASIAVLSCSICAADEIVFKNQGTKQIGTVVEENEQGVTIIFPKESIKSINRKAGGPIPTSSGVIVEDRGGYLTVKIPHRQFEAASSEIKAASQPAAQAPVYAPAPADSQLSEKVDRLEKKIDTMEKAGPPPGGKSIDALLKEEAGSIEGVILWNGKPLKNAKVKIVMETYTGFSVAALKQTFAGGENKPAPSEITLDTQTDSGGHYSFPQVPPGSYTLFWQPDLQTGWVRRIRENPDFEIVPGKLIVLNIPEKKKKM
ncbi:MAG: carboxypeptidase-like regulatory domain-containing protein [Syntrophobacteraceae bacterium]|jgi:hypothetical protein